jgi:hypothetical protein
MPVSPIPLQVGAGDDAATGPLWWQPSPAHERPQNRVVPSMLASFAASMLNQKHSDLGSPIDQTRPIQL